MELLKLPSELHFAICQYLPLSDLLNVALSCKALCAPASNACVEHITLKFCVPMWEKFRKMAQLASLLDNSTTLASAVRHVRLHSYRQIDTATFVRVPQAELGDPVENQDTHDCSCGCKLAKQQKSHSRNCNARFLRPGRFHSVLQQLLDSCPGLRSLTFTGLVTSKWARGLGYSRMHQLAEVSLTESQVLEDSMIQQLSLLPKLRRLSLNFRGFAGLSPWTLPTIQNLTNLKLTMTPFFIEELQILLMLTPNVTSLDVDLGLSLWLYKLFDTQLDMDLCLLRKALDGQMRTENLPNPNVDGSNSTLANLEHLRLAISFSDKGMLPDTQFRVQGGNTEDDRHQMFLNYLNMRGFSIIYALRLRGSIGSLKGLSKLKTLEISPHVLIDQSKQEVRTLASFLPDSLQELRLRDDPVWWCTFGDPAANQLARTVTYTLAWDRVELDKMLTEYSTGHVHFPKLKLIVGLTRRKDAVLRGTGFPSRKLIYAMARRYTVFGIEEITGPDDEEEEL